MSSDQRKKSAFQRSEFVGVDRLAGAVEGDDDREADSDLGGGDRDDEENQHLAVVVGQAVRLGVETGEGDQREIRRAEHELEAHEDDDDVPAQHHAGKADAEEQTGNEEVIVQCSHLKKLLVISEQ